MLSNKVITLNLEHMCVPTSANIHEAIEAIHIGAKQICLVVDDSKCLLGSVTDGDIRRGLLHGKSMSSSITSVMNPQPIVATPETAENSLLAMMNKRALTQIPIVNNLGVVVGLVHQNDLLSVPDNPNNWVVLMAGGLGTRLRPITENTPKPLIHVGGKPILETILNTFQIQNFQKFFISVNYKADAIKKHFGDGRKWNVNISYLEEKEQLGTAGSLSLFKERPTAPIIVMNADLLTQLDYVGLLKYHEDNESVATMCVREYDIQVPFGVVDIKDRQIFGVDEKPIHRFFVNAGIYVLSPEIIDIIPPNAYFDMTRVFDKIIESGYKTAAFPIHEYWLDIGRIDDLHKANVEISERFSK